MTIQTGGRKLLIHGLGLTLAGLVGGFLPLLAPYARLGLSAHITFVTHGMLFVLLALVLLNVPHRAGLKSMRVMLVTAWLVWFMALCEATNAWWGVSELHPIAARQAGATGGEAWQAALMKLSHVSASLALMVSVALLLKGVLEHRAANESEPAQ